MQQCGLFLRFNVFYGHNNQLKDSRWQGHTLNWKTGSLPCKVWPLYIAFIYLQSEKRRLWCNEVRAVCPSACSAVLSCEHKVTKGLDTKMDYLFHQCKWAAVVKTASGANGAGWTTTILLCIFYLSVPGHCFACVPLSAEIVKMRAGSFFSNSAPENNSMSTQHKNVWPTNSVIDCRKLLTNPCSPDGTQNHLWSLNHLDPYSVIFSLCLSQSWVF